MKQFKKKLDIHLVAAARPNFVKIAPLFHALLKEDWAEPIIVHTGQHYDLNMSQTFFTELGLPEPDVHLGIGSGTHAEQTAGVLVAYEKILLEKQPDLVIVVGDVNSTMACTLTAKKLNIKVAHLEAGLRSFDRTMPEEINRVVTDSLADILWTPSPDADENLIHEGITPEKIHRVGNIMIDSLIMMKTKIENAGTYKKLGQKKGAYGVVTIHRPSNVDNPEKLKKLCEVFCRISEDHPIIFPIHPRTRKQLRQFNLDTLFKENDNIFLIEPLGYTSFMNIVIHSKMVITDSGGIQEETTYLGIPCFTLRKNTERPITLEIGTNHLSTPESIEQDIAKTDFDNLVTEIPSLWDGKTASRIIQTLKSNL